MITLQLTAEESRLVQAALDVEITKGTGTFLPAPDVIKLEAILNLLKSKDLT